MTEICKINDTWTKRWVDAMRLFGIWKYTCKWKDKG